MESFSLEIFSSASAQPFPDNTLSSFKIFLPKQLKVEGQWEIAILEISYPSMYQKVTEGTFMFFHKKLSKSPDFYYLGPGLRPFDTNFVEAVNTLIQEKHNHSKTCITVKVSQTTQKNEFYVANEGVGLAFFSMNLGHIFGCNVGNEDGVMLRAKEPIKLDFTYDIVRIHSLMLYTDLVEYNIIGNTKAPLLHCLPFISKPKAGDIITTEQCMNYQTFSALQFKPLFKNSLRSIHIDLRNTSGEKTPYICWDQSLCFDV